MNRRQFLSSTIPLSLVAGCLRGETDNTPSTDTTPSTGNTDSDAEGSSSESTTAGVDDRSEINWPQYGSNAANTGYIPTPAGPTEIAERGKITSRSGESIVRHDNQLYTGGYVINTEDDSVSSIVNRGSHAVVHDEQLFVSGSAEDGKLGRVSAFALGSLSSSWDKTLEPVDDDRSFPMGSPTFAHETIYQATGDGTLHAINSATGDTRWRYDLGGQKAQTPAVQDDVIYVSGERETVALSRTGDTNWTRSDAFSSSPVVKDDNLFFFGRDGDRAVYSLDVNDGSIRWSKDIGSSNWAPGIRNLAVDADSVYVNTDATIQRFSRSDGVEEWQTQFEGAGELCTSENQVYAVGRDNSGGGITAVAKDTGAEVWTEIVDSPIMTEPIISGANLYFGTGDGTYLITGMTDG